MKRFIRLALLYLLAFAARPFARRQRGPIASVLYLKPDHLGDLLLATPALAALRQRMPYARITALVGPWAEMVLRRNPDVDLLLSCPFPGFTRAPQTHGAAAFTHTLWALAKPYLLLLRYAVLLRAGRYDLAIVGRDDHWWGAALALLAGVPQRVGFAVPECRPFLTSALPWDARSHVTEQGLALVAAAGALVGQGDKQPRRMGELASLSPDLPVSQAARFDPASADLAWAEGWLREQGLEDDKLVVLHAGTAGPAKLWFPERWAAVADALSAAGGRLVLTGGPGEEALAAAVAAQMRTPAIVLAGQTSVGQLAALLRRSAITLGVDSGPLHLAAAQGARTIHLYGPGDPARFGPWGDGARHVVVREELWCSPCGVFSACPRGLDRPECMERIGVAQVVAEAKRMLGVETFRAR